MLKSCWRFIIYVLPGKLPRPVLRVRKLLFFPRPQLKGKNCNRKKNQVCNRKSHSKTEESHLVLMGHLQGNDRILPTANYTGGCVCVSVSVTLCVCWGGGENKEKMESDTWWLLFKNLSEVSKFRYSSIPAIGLIQTEIKVGSTTTFAVLNAFPLSRHKNPTGDFKGTFCLCAKALCCDIRVSTGQTSIFPLSPASFISHTSLSKHCSRVASDPVVKVMGAVLLK